MADWSPSGRGQRHKDWCRHQCGEEDVDFQVVAVEGKGLGIVAKKFIASKYRIIVETLFAEDTAEEDDGEPWGPTLTGLMKRFQSGVHPPSKLRFKRSSRVNHDCDPNADLFYTGDGVAILYANRDIEPGEEIRRTYLPFSKMFDEPVAIHLQFQCREAILRKVGIICAPNCICKSDDTRKWIAEAKQLKTVIQQQTEAGRFVDVLQSFERFVAVQKLIATPLVVIALHSHLDAFEACQRYYCSLPREASIADIELCERGVEHGRIALDLSQTLRPHQQQEHLKKDVEDLTMFISNYKHVITAL